MADNDDELSRVTAPPPLQSHRIVDEGLGAEVVEEDLLNLEQGAAVVDGVESEGFEIDGSKGVVGSVEVRVGEEGDDETEVVKGGGDFKLESVGASEGCVANENDMVEEIGELENNDESGKTVEGEDAVEKEREEFENNMDACGDVEKINESSRKVDEDCGKENLAANSDLVGMVLEDCHTKEVVQEKGEEFVMNLAMEECPVMTVCEKVREDDVEERAPGGSNLVGKGVEDCHKNVSVEEQMREEKNLAAEERSAVTAIGDTAQIDGSRNTLKDEEAVEENVAGITDLICMVATEDSQMNNVIVGEKSEESEKKIAFEHCAVVNTIGTTYQIADSMNNSNEDVLQEENVTGVSEKIGVEVTKDNIEKSGNADYEYEACDGDEVMRSGEEISKNKEKLEEDILAAPDVEFSLHKDVSKPTTIDGEEEMGAVEEITDNKENTEKYISEAPDVEFSLHKVVLERATVDGDEQMGSEEENTGNKEKLEESLSTAPSVEFSLCNVVLEPTTGDGDEEMILEVENKWNKEKLQEDLSTAPDAEFSLHNIVPEIAAGDADEKLEKVLLTAPDVEFLLCNVVPGTAAGDGDEEMGTEEGNSEDKDKLEKDFSTAPDVEFSLHNIELEPTAGEEDEEFVDGAEPSTVDAIESKIETPDSEKSNFKPKRGRKPSKVALTKKTEEDVCFICFDGGDLVVCDRRGCPKVYHPSCVNRDEEFFKAKGRWNCGWHICSKCEKNAQYMCLTCTFSLCKGCIKDTDFYSARGNKGFCETCFKTVKLIESREEGNNEENSNFDDKTCWESLFKDYWIDMKKKLQLTSEELAQAKNPCKGSDVITSKQKPADETYNVNDNADSGLNNSSGNLIAVTPKRKKSKRLSKSVAKSEDSPSGSDSSGNGSKSKRRKTNKQLTPSRKRVSLGNGGVDTGSKWASVDLLKFVMHMRNGDASVLSQFEVQELLLEYIKTNKLRDPRRKSQIICDAMLKGLFGKQRVGHFEMLKLLESHFLMKEDSNVDEFHGSGVDNVASPSDELAKTEASAKTNKDKKRKMRRKGFGGETQSNTADYAAINIHNISLVFLRRNLMEILLEDIDNFQDKVVGAFVRIRITGSNQIQDMYRLVQIVGTTKASMPYKVGKRTTDFNLEIQNLNKQEVVSIDIISNQEFTEDECSRLRQSIKCGLIPRLTVGDILEKAMDLQAARVNDWLETEMVRLSHLCDRASDMGRRKELRENVEKLQNLKKPEERQRRLEEIPEVHSDPKMDPSYESDEEEEADDRKQETFFRSRGSSLNRVGKDSLSPRKGGSAVTDSWSGTKGHSDTSRELGRSLSSKGFSSKGDDTSLTGEFTRVHGRSDENELLRARDNSEKQVSYSSQLGGGNTHAIVASDLVGGSVSDSHQTIASLSPRTTTTVNESEKIWHYKDPSGKVQGPFSIVQLRKWNSTGFFPKDLSIWKINEGQDDGILLLDALAGKFHKEINLNGKLSNISNIVQSGLSSLSHSGRTAADGSMANGASASQISSVGRTRISVDVSMSSGGNRSSGYDNRNDFTNLPSPTPNQILGSTGGEASVNRLSSVARTAPGSLSADGTQLYRSPTTSSASNPYQTTYSQQTSASGYHMQQSNPSAGAESMKFVAPQAQPSGHNASNNQISLSASNAYNQWSNPAVASTEKPGASFPNQGFSGTPALTTWRPPTIQQPGMQPMVVPDQSWRPVAGNPNMGWGAVQANTSVSWTPTGQVTPQINPNWAVQGMVPVIGNAAAGWVSSANSMPYGTQVNNQFGGIMNPGWALPTSLNTSTNQPWAAAGQGSLPTTASHNNNPSNQASWAANGQNANDGYSNNRQQGGDGGYHQRGGGGQPRVCEYYLSNRCRKGSGCKWLHPQRQ